MAAVVREPGLCLPLAVVAAGAVPAVAVAEHLAVVPHHLAAVVHLSGHLLAVLRHHLLALLHVGHMDLDVKLLVALLPLILYGFLVALLLHILLAVGALK